MDELIKRLRNDAESQERLLHICDSTQNAKEAANALEELQAQLAQVTAERDFAVKFIRHIDKNYSRNLPEDFSYWRKEKP